MVVRLILEPPFSHLVSRKAYDVDVAPGTTAQGLFRSVTAGEPTLGNALLNLEKAFGDRFYYVFAIGGYRIAEDRVLKDNDQVQVFSPIMGG